MRSLTVRLLTWLALSVLCASLYGILNDQVTVTISPEYFSVFKRQQFMPILILAHVVNAPLRIQAVVVGIAATWWFGLFLGILVCLFGLVGRAPRLETREFARIILFVMLLSALLSFVFGSLAYRAEPSINPAPEDWPFLYGMTDIRRAFAVGA